MSSKSIELSILGQVVRLTCPEEQHADLLEAAKALENKVLELKERSGMVQLDRALAIVGLNLCYELAQAQRNTQAAESRWQTRLQQLDHSLETVLARQNLSKSE